MERTRAVSSVNSVAWGRGVEVADNMINSAKCTARQFVESWQTPSSLAEVAMKARMKKSACRVRASRYRQLGIPLKEFPPVIIEPTNWSELAEYAAHLVKGVESAN